MPKRYGFRWKNKKVKKERSRKGVKARLRNIEEACAPDYPVDDLDCSKDYRIIHIENCMAGVKTETVLLLTPTKPKEGRVDQFHVWLDMEYQEKPMGWKRAYTLAGQQFVRMGSM